MIEPEEFYKLTEAERMKCLVDRAMYGQYIIRKEPDGSVRHVPPDEFYKEQA